MQPPFSPDDCLLAERIAKGDTKVQRVLKEMYGIEDIEFVRGDPWSVHISTPDAESLLKEVKNEKGEWVKPRLVQLFMYQWLGEGDNHYAHPLDFVPIVDLNLERVVRIDGEANEGSKGRREVAGMKVNYGELEGNSYLEREVREDVPKVIEIVQPEGPSFRVEGGFVRWQKWTVRVGFNYREGVVLHNVKYDGRPVLWRASLVEMAVPYGDPHETFTRKCAFDVGDYSIGTCANSLELDCDCLGHIKYFDATLCNSEGEPYTIKHAVCMHEEDSGILWKHMEYRTGQAESRRARRLVISFIATVVNYEYLFYWYLNNDGSIEFEIKLSGELSTNMLSLGETEPEFGTLVAPEVNAQIHQHMFCVRLDVCVDGLRNSISEVDIKPVWQKHKNSAGNAFQAVSTPLNKESQAQRVAAPARAWRIANQSSRNFVSGMPVAYKLVPYTRGAYNPLLLTSPESAVTKRGKFATKSLWVTPYNEEERFPAGKYPTQGTTSEGLSKWVQADRSLENEDIVLWHSFGVAHQPRVEDFPVMPCELTGFSLKPDGFFKGNPGIDLPPTRKGVSRCCNGTTT